MNPIPPDHTAVERLVVRAPNWLGDALMALPAIGALRRHFRGAHLTVAAPAGFAAIFDEETGAAPDAVLRLPKRPRDIRDALAAGRFDLGILLPNSFRSAWLMRRAGIPARWGVARSWRGPLLTRRPVRIPTHGVVHQAEVYRNLVRGFGIPCDDDAPRLRVRAATRAAGRARLGDRVPAGHRLGVLAPGAAYGQAKQWPPDRVADLAARMIRDRGMTCVLVGAAHDRDAARAVEARLASLAPDLGDRLVDLTGRTSLPELMGVLALADVVVSNDSGAMHLAAAIDRPVVAVFGPTDERATRPLGPHAVLTAPAFCRPCHLRDCPIDHRCMKRITVDAVFAAVSRQLAFRRAEGPA